MGLGEPHTLDLQVLPVQGVSRPGAGWWEWQLGTQRRRLLPAGPHPPRPHHQGSCLLRTSSVLSTALNGPSGLSSCSCHPLFQSLQPGWPWEGQRPGKHLWRLLTRSLEGGQAWGSARPGTAAAPAVGHVGTWRLGGCGRGGGIAENGGPRFENSLGLEAPVSPE